MKKDILAVFAIILIVAAVINGTHIQSVDEYYLTHIDDITSESETVKISIRCDTILDNYGNLEPALQSDEFVPPDGIILPETEYVLREGDTVFDILDRAVRYNRIQMEFQGADENSYGSVYIQGINYLYEFSCGPLSGWMYRVDGEFPNYGCSKYKLRDGQVIEWVYTCGLGTDVGCYFVGGEERMKAFGNYHPMVLMTYFLSVLLVVMFVPNPVLQLSALLGACAFSAIISRRRQVLSDIGFYVPMFLMVAVTNPLFSHNGVTPLFLPERKPRNSRGVIYGAAIAVTVIGVMLWCKAFGAVMSSDKFLYLFGRAVPKLSLVLSMALRFVPRFKRQMKTVSRAQKAMGLYSSKSYTDKIKNAGRVFTAMISRSIENSMETSDSMRARGYGMKGRSSFSLFRFHTHDGILLAICAALLMFTLAGFAFSKLDFYYYPRISRLPVTPFAVSVYAAFGILSFCPFIIEVKEALVWKYCVSRI